MKFKFTILLLLPFFCKQLTAQKTATLIYIDQYKDIAIREMNRTGIPASITLAQGIVESNSGESNLALNFNNHFGIKCKSDWKGETTYQDDDTKQECFRVYPNAIASFIDHSNFIKNRPNYAPLFQLDPVDDSAWAIGLKKAGYATASDYAKKIMKVIDDYELSQYNFPELKDENDTIIPSITALDSTNKYANQASLPINNIKGIEPSITNSTVNLIKMNSIGNDNTQATKAIASKPQTTTMLSDTFAKANKTKIGVADTDSLKTSKKTTTLSSKDTSNKKQINGYPDKPFKINQISVIWAMAGTSFLQIATENNIPLYKIFVFNDLKESDLLEQDQLLFLGNKKAEGEKSFHLVTNGETLYEISQKEGIQIKKLKEYNLIINLNTPAVGTQLILVKPKEQKTKLSLNK